jgi:hypothetical protein
MARALEQMALLNITLQVRSGWPWQTVWSPPASIGRSSPRGRIQRPRSVSAAAGMVRDWNRWPFSAQTTIASAINP